MARYKIINVSGSSHCCFEATVVDTEKKDEEFGCEDGYIVCECFNVESAELICKALNNVND